MSESWKSADAAYDAYDERLDDVRAPGWEDAVAASAAAGALVPVEAPLAPDDVTGNLRRYARWQWRDFWQRRGFWMAAAALLGVWLLSWLVRHNGPNPANGPMAPGATNLFAHALFALGGFAAGLLSTGGLVARERERGLQRFLFAKPVPIVRYYLQMLGIHAVGSLLVIAGAVLLTALVVAAPISVATVLAGAATTYVLASGMTFLVSTLFRFDAPVAAAWLGFGMPVAALAANGFWWAKLAQWLFPQGAALALAQAVAGPGGPANDAAVLALGLLLGLVVAVPWGLACVVAGVAVLRRRSIQT